ncbi:polyprenyl synthetase family protein [Streptomyces sp. NPDC087420]|uniref:polyprenyl synthetase family protein n=1 Tax=Streptomyces sp. NPDC087420 TaxID=3365785 RepID=UPI003837E2F3
MSDPSPATPFDQDALRRAVDTVLADHLSGQMRDARRHGLPREAVQALSDFLGAGGKRIRPVLCVAGRQAAGGAGAPEAVLRAAASLEMFHAFALIHDDIIDASDTRRGRPTVHRQVGTEAAILVGDLALVLADDLLHSAGLTPDQLAAVLPVANQLRADTIYGDLRKGKATVLMALALHHADAGQLRALRRHVGNPYLNHDDAAHVRTILIDTGARAALEEMIAQRRQNALTTLDTAALPLHIKAVLRSLAFTTTSRTT